MPKVAKITKKLNYLFAKRGGLSKSARKQEAARINGAKGGRPKKLNNGK